MAQQSVIKAEFLIRKSFKIFHLIRLGLKVKSQKGTWKFTINLYTPRKKTYYGALQFELLCSTTYYLSMWSHNIIFAIHFCFGYAPNKKKKVRHFKSPCTTSISPIYPPYVLSFFYIGVLVSTTGGKKLPKAALKNKQKGFFFLHCQEQ